MNPTRGHRNHGVAAGSFFAALLVVLDPVAHAQTETLTRTGQANGLRVTVTSPTTGEGAVDCVFQSTSGTCRPLNQSSCLDGSPNEGRILEADLALTNFNNLTGLLPQVVANSRVSVWRSSSASCATTTPPEPSDPLVLDTLTLGAITNFPILFPSQFDDGGDYRLSELLDAVGACGGATEQDVYLCFAIDVPTSTVIGAINPIVTPTGSLGEIRNGIDPWASVSLRVDLVPPAGASLSKVAEEDGAIRAEVGSSASDLALFEVRAREVPDDETVDPTTDDCRTWPTVYGDVRRAQQIGTTSPQSLRLTGLKNGVNYRLCGLVYDTGGNQSEPSETTDIKPIDECDFLECYPGELKTGYCQSMGPNGLVVVSLIVSIALLARRRARRIP